MKTPMPCAPAARGFTLIELMVVVTVLAVMLAIAGPSFAAMLRQWRLNSTVETLLGDLRLARSTAIRSSRPVGLCVRNGDQCGTGSNWAVGWMLYSDRDGGGTLDAGEPVIVQRGPQPGIATITVNSTTPLGFRSNGTLNSAMAGINVEPLGATAASPGVSIGLTAMGRPGVKNMTPNTTDGEKKK